MELIKSSVSVCVSLRAVCTMRKVDLCCDENFNLKGHGCGVRTFRQRERVHLCTPVHTCQLFRSVHISPPTTEAEDMLPFY